MRSISSCHLRYTYYRARRSASRPCIRKPALPPPAPYDRTRLLRGRVPAAFDAEVVAIVRSLPFAARRVLCCVGVLNEAGQLYRRVDLFSPLELLEFTARMNAAGFGKLATLRGGVSKAYEAVFARRTSAHEGA